MDDLSAFAEKFNQRGNYQVGMLKVSELAHIQ